MRSAILLPWILIFCLAPGFAQTGEKRIAPVSSDLRQSFERQPRIAVLAGVGQYPSRSGLGRLRYPAHDVDLLSAELTKQGYTVVALKDQEATRGSIESALKDATELVDRGRGTVLFFFSGHGFADKGENFLATFEATAGDLAGSGLAVNRVEALLKSTGSPRQVMFIDACRNEPGKTVGARSFDRFEASAGLRELLSTKAGHISYEDDQLGSGVFTHFLVEGLRGEAAGQDGLITFRDLADYVTGAVSRFGFERGEMQVPYEAGESSGDFLLARVASAPVSNGPPSGPPPPVPIQPAVPSIAGTTWSGTDSDGNIVFEFQANGTLHYTYSAGSFSNGTWKQDGNSIYMEINDRYAEYHGQISGDRMEGKGQSKNGSEWTWVAQIAPIGPAVPSIAGTTWSGTDSDGNIVFEFQANGTLHYTYSAGSFSNGTWKQDGNSIYMEINDRYAEYNGQVSGERMEGKGRSKNGNEWTWVAQKK